MKALLKRIIVLIVTFEAKLVLRKYKPTIVVVTGSVGKTSMKDAIGTVLSSKFYVRKSEKSFNSETGVPLTILGCENPWNNYALWFKVIIEGFWLIVSKNHYPKMLVLEVGADKPGDVSGMMEWITPDVVVVTKLPTIPVHVEAYASPNQTREEEFSPAHALAKDGVLIYSADDEYAKELARGIHAKTITYGFDAGADIEGLYGGLVYDNESPKGFSADILYNKNKACVVVHGAAGKHQLYPALGSFAAGMVFEMNAEEICKALEGYTPPPGRMRLLRGLKHSLIIDDSYNSSPVAVLAALNTLSEIQAPGRVIAVLGDMLELGTFSIEEHAHVGRCAAKCVDILVTVGLRAQGIQEGAFKARMAKKRMHHFQTAKEAGTFLKDFIEEGDVVLIKGSQGIRLERAVEEILASPSDTKYLVRQDDEWKKR